eukprot:CAMPEP_0178427406 /NCGR_PEP_ID=MMETSP0689_2-20121128/29731_1 /TAXON_ID=160604 /ORGANISM="Amphidinium massartii, Strain CS-259" /LENGTH=349 /DNA_ID=CAMNT_0020049117 /DNA_START=59 /DNA_END=1108 /DNA_ORIENTATION=-
MAATASTPPRRDSSLTPPMVAIMEGQAEEYRRALHSFKVCAQPGSADPSGEIPPHADILVFGPTGSGKSSLIRTFYMALHRTTNVPADFSQRIIIQDTATNEGTLKYVSAVIKPRKLDHRGATSSSAIICHDTRGQIWMDEREQKQLGVILDGAIKDDCIVQQRNYRYARLLWEFWRKDSELFPTEILVRKNGLGTKPHALLFVFDGSKDEIPDGQEETRFYREIIQQCREKGYQYPQVVLTRIDKVEEELAKEPGLQDADRDLKLRQILDKKIEDVVMRLDISRNAVHFIENYHVSDGSLASLQRNVSVDFHAVKILNQCVNNADSFVSQHLKTNGGRPPPNPQCLMQ